MNMAMQNNISGTSQVSDEKVYTNYLMSPKKMLMDMHMLMAMYGITGNFSVMGMVNYNISSMQMNMIPTESHNHAGMMNMQTRSNMMNSKTSGIGDIKLWLLYELYNHDGASLLLSTGISLPIGKTNIYGGNNTMYEGQKLPYMMQMGTGSMDIMPGITYLKKYDQLTLSTQALSIIRPFYNFSGYHYGNELQINAWAAYEILPSFSFSLRAEGYKAGNIKGNDAKISSEMEPASSAVNYGGARANGYAGINYYVNKNYIRNCKIGIEFGLPLYQNLNGIQLSTRYTLNARITKSF